MDLQRTLIIYKTRLKILLRFFNYKNVSGYLLGFFKELDENIYNEQVELNRLEANGLLSSELHSMPKVYFVNTVQPLTFSLISIVLRSPVLMPWWAVSWIICPAFNKYGCFAIWHVG